jgi:hypothetical protein
MSRKHAVAMMLALSLGPGRGCVVAGSVGQPLGAAVSNLPAVMTLSRCHGGRIASALSGSVSG